MLFVTADLHGFPLHKFLALLNKAEFGKREDDFLFILGDVIDRNGDGGIDKRTACTDEGDRQGCVE